MQKRGVKMDSFLFDDGWDDNQTLWSFQQRISERLHSAEERRPQNSTPASASGFHLSAATTWQDNSGLKYASERGFETNSSGFSLSGPKYFQRFHDICLEMIQKYSVNQFKFDGLAAGGKASETGLTRDGDAMLRLD